MMRDCVHAMTGRGVLSLVRPLVLASASPRRRAFLQEMGLACEMVSPPEDAEPLPQPTEEPEAFAARAARMKAESVLALDGSRAGGASVKGAAILGADTIVALDGAILGKPRDEEEAFAFVQRLAGKEHHVYTACCLLLPDGVREVFAAGAAVRMGNWPESVLRAYAASGEGLDKAGGYAVQGHGAFLVERVTGSWSAVVGLPVAETVAALLRHGIIVPSPQG